MVLKKTEKVSFGSFALWWVQNIGILVLERIFAMSRNVSHIFICDRLQWKFTISNISKRFPTERARNVLQKFYTIAHCD